MILKDNVDNIYGEDDVDDDNKRWIRVDDDDDNGVDDDGDNDYKRWFRVVDGSGGRPPCSPPRRPHLPRGQGLPEEDRQSSSCLDCLGCLFFGHQSNTVVSLFK